MIRQDARRQVDLLMGQAEAASDRGDSEGARAAFQLVTQLEPNNEEAWLWLASLSTDLQEIAGYLRRVIEINPSNAEAAATLKAVTAKMPPQRSNASGPLTSGPLKSGPLTSQTPGRMNSGPLAAQTSAPPKSALPASSQQAGSPPPAPGAPKASSTPATSSAPSSNSGPLTARISGPLAPGNSGPLTTSGPLPNSGSLTNSGPLRTSGPLTSGPLTISGPLMLEQLTVEELKRRGIIAAKARRLKEATECLLAATEKNDTDPETWFWLSTVVESLEDRQVALENVLVLDPLNVAAAEALEEVEQLRAQQAAPPPEPAPAFERSKLMETPPPGSIDANHPPMLFAHAAAPTDGKKNKKAKEEVEDDSVIAGRYRILQTTQTSFGAEFVAWDNKAHNYSLLRPIEAAQPGESQLRYRGTNYNAEVLPTSGMTLHGLIETVGHLPADMVTQYGLDMLKRLSTEHASGPIISARKFITPDTVALSSAGNMDLEPPGELYSASRPERVVRPFLPPEQVQSGVLAPSSDIYAVGALLFYMLTGSPPPESHLIPRKMGETFEPPLFEGYNTIPAEMVPPLATALQSNPDDRYSSADEMAEALRAASGEKRVSVSIPWSQIPWAQVGLAVVGFVFVVGLAWALGSGKFSNLKLLNILGGASTVAASPTAVPVVAAPPPPPPPLAKVSITGLDTHTYPINRVFVRASDPAGQPVFGIGASSLKVQENGVDIWPTEFTELRRTTDPISVIVALDTSAPMAGRRLDDAKTAVHILAGLMQPGDHMALITFGGTAQLAVDYNVAPRVVLGGVDQQAAGDKREIAGVFNVASDLARNQKQGGYTALIVISNGALPADKNQVNTMISAANAANLPVFYMGLDKATYPYNVAGEIASATGGEAIVAESDDTGGAGEAVKKIERMLHNVYKISYESQLPASAGDHTLEVTMTLRDQVQADKRSYQVWGK